MLGTIIRDALMISLKMMIGDRKRKSYSRQTIRRTKSASSDNNIADDSDVSSLKGELEVIFESLSDKASLILKEWDEIRKLIDEGLLGVRTRLRTCGRQP